MTFWFPSWRSLNLSKWSLNHPQKGTKNCQVYIHTFSEHSFFAWKKMFPPFQGFFWSRSLAVLQVMRRMNTGPLAAAAVSQAKSVPTMIRTAEFGRWVVVFFFLAFPISGLKKMVQNCPHKKGNCVMQLRDNDEKYISTYTLHYFFSCRYMTLQYIWEMYGVVPSDGVPPLSQILKNTCWMIPSVGPSIVSLDFSGLKMFKEKMKGRRMLHSATAIAQWHW